MSSKSKRIIKNTAFLYIRMLFLMLITLFTSRVILDKLGIEDFGIYNVVGGLVMMFAFFSSSLANATQRFLNIELGKNDIEKATMIFSQHLVIYVCVAAIVILFAETVGLWFVYEKLVIPENRMTAAFWVFQFTILQLALTLVSIVFESEIIAHEDMKIYSYVGMVEGLGKLLIAYTISIISFDRLITYSFLLLLITIPIKACFVIFCLKHYQECRFVRNWKITSLIPTFKFISWNVAGTFIYAIRDQGGNILLNLFYGPAVNAARAVSYQVNSAIISFSTNFFTSVRPQITKSYAAGDMEYLKKLFFKSSKYSVFLMWFFILPVILHVDVILGIWLKDVPEYTEDFIVWILIDSLLAILTNPTWSVTLATGNLKKYTLLGNGCLLLVFPISYILMSSGHSPVCLFITILAVRVLQVILVLDIVNRMINFSKWQYLKTVIRPSLIVCGISGCLTYLFCTFFPHNFISLLLTCVFSVGCITFCIWMFGTDDTERQQIQNYIRKFRNKIHS